MLRRLFFVQHQHHLALAPFALAAFDRKCTYLELSSSKEFMENYVEYMAFDEDE